ncbi:type IV pilus twitching motility protein PilT [Herbaspirillum robiniae]|uniref:Twitching motility protein PilT n=1 Tax=Herbaspirillum robiniae TaxID=2014887 RepID=A0A246WMF8_9BURK|nr:type IV pilus twitching motility protein PilT [Herbaspirillum robiniae]NUU04384.1 type IV pilus twitching motility protein PilT [Herbaspirillum robiniae]OWY27541.1 twitching motility protein PilT [Herbaspirillum robiniae]
MDIAGLLAFAVRNQASDLHLSAGLPPMLRVHGDIRRINLTALSDEQLQSMLQSVMTEAQRAAYAERMECDFSFHRPGLGRFRVNAYRQQRGAAAAIRHIPQQIPALTAIGAPAVCAELALRPRGLVLVTGATGSGKSTTLAAMVGHINEHRAAHIITVEDPIEFIHEPRRSLVSQRELGAHTRSFADALRGALREDPDVLLVGELRDAETIRLALTAAETGHLVFGTLHTASAAKTVDRIVDVFAPGEKDGARAMLAESLQAVISQTLLPAPDGHSRVAAHEVMLCTPAIRNLIREGKTAQLYSAIQTATGLGMQTLEGCLGELVHAERITLETARAHARSPDFFPM